MNKAGKLFTLEICPMRRSTLRTKPMNSFIFIEFFFTQNRMSDAKSDHALGKTKNFLILVKMGPVHPAGFIVLTIGVVIATLSAANFVPTEYHRNTARNHQGQHKILYLAISRRLDFSGFR